MMRCSRPMSWALASTWPSGGRRSTRRAPSASTTAVGQVGVTAGDDLERERRLGAVDVVDEPRRDAVDVDAGDRRGRSLGVGDPACPRRVQPGARASVAWAMAAIDVTDATFETEVVEPVETVPVVVDLWAPWCGPCSTLGPIIEKVVDATDGQVALVKVNVDENPAISQAFRVQSIPAVYAMRDGQVVDGFVGAYPEHEVQRFVDCLLPTEERARSPSWSPPATRPACARCSTRAGQRGRHRRPRRAARRPGRRRRGAGAARADPRVRAHPQGRRRRPARRRAPPTTTTPRSPGCSTG